MSGPFVRRWGRNRLLAIYDFPGAGSSSTSIDGTGLPTIRTDHRSGAPPLPHFANAFVGARGNWPAGLRGDTQGSLSVSDHLRLAWGAAGRVRNPRVRLSLRQQKGYRRAASGECRGGKVSPSVRWSLPAKNQLLVSTMLYAAMPAACRPGESTYRQVIDSHQLAARERKGWVERNQRVA